MTTTMMQKLKIDNKTTLSVFIVWAEESPSLRRPLRLASSGYRASIGMIADPVSNAYALPRLLKI
eukprot:769715-Amphidinium_carterae.1